jgi:hypothetical protein
MAAVTSLVLAMAAVDLSSVPATLSTETLNVITQISIALVLFANCFFLALLTGNKGDPFKMYNLIKNYEPGKQLFLIVLIFAFLMAFQYLLRLRNTLSILENVENSMINQCLEKEMEIDVDLSFHKLTKKGATVKRIELQKEKEKRSNFFKIITISLSFFLDTFKINFLLIEVVFFIVFIFSFFQPSIDFSNAAMLACVYSIPYGVFVVFQIHLNQMAISFLSKSPFVD